MTTHAVETHALENAPALAHTTKQACARLNIGKTLLFQLLDAKELRAIRLGKKLLIPEAELQALISRRLSSASRGT